MSVEQKIQPFDIMRSGAKIVAAGIAYGVPGVALVTLVHHRQDTHRSVKVHPVIERITDFIMQIYSPDRTDWSSTHRVHHFNPDVTLYPFYRITQAIHWIGANPSRAHGIKIPDAYQHLDRFVTSFSKEDVLEIGHIAEQIVRDRLEGAYQPPESYKLEDLQTILNPTEAQYHYSQKLKNHKGEYSQEEIAEVLLGDPHSATRMSGSNGVREVLLGNVGLYRASAHLFRDMPHLKPKDLQLGKEVDHRKARIRGFIEGSLVAAGLVLLARNKYQPKDFLKALLAGTAINTVAVGLHISGGNITNSLGHAGLTTTEGFLQAIGAKEYKLILNPDGTVSTDSVSGGLLGRIVSWLTFDEVGGQREHHLHPEQIAFTSQKGPKAWIEAPWGRLLTVLAESKYFPLISPGEGFDLKEGETRPDMPNPAVEIINRRRVEQQQEQLRAA